MSAATLAVAVVAATLLAAVVMAPRRRGASTLDFYLAGQRIGVATNANAICGDYFSAASFLGVAAAVYTSGLDGVWYATGFAAGFVPVALLVAAPLRRFGEFSIPDFLGRRFASDRVRLTAVTVVQLVILSYLVPQAVGSGITWELLVDVGIGPLSPYATGVVVSTAAIAVLVAFGGMRGTTWTQAVQFLVLLAAVVWLVGAALAHGFSYPAAVEQLGNDPLVNPVQAPDGTWSLEPETNRLRSDEPATFGRAGARYGPVGQLTLVVTLVLGTAGLPHVMNRLFTAPSGRAARTTTVWVLGLAGAFYSMAVLLGTAARSTIPDAIADHPWIEPLTVDGVLRVPEHALLVLGRIYGGPLGLGAVSAGALVAVMSTIAGLLLASAASWGHDVYERHVNPRATQAQAVRAGRVAVLLVAGTSAGLALALNPESMTHLFPSLIAVMVTWAFALAGSSITPVLILSIWWRGTTARGAATGIAVGATVAVTSLVVGLALDLAPEAGALLLTPALVAAPLALGTAVAVSRRTTPPADVDAVWVRLHGTASDRRAERLAALTLRGIGADELPRRGRGRR